MQLYFSPLACSLASRIAFQEAGAQVKYTQVDGKTKRTADGTDYFSINPMGQVPVLRTDDGELLTENAAILQFIADRYPDAKLAPPSGMQRAHLQEWLSFIGTELHKLLFMPLFDKQAPDAAKAHTRTLIPRRFGVLQNHLAKQEFLLESFSVADAYLTTILNWTAVTDVSLEPYPAVAQYHQRLIKRPSIAKAFGEEFALYKQEQARSA